jgi:hypothetical protein
MMNRELQNAFLLIEIVSEATDTARDRSLGIFIETHHSPKSTGNYKAARPKWNDNLAAIAKK